MWRGLLSGQSIDILSMILGCMLWFNQGGFTSPPHPGSCAGIPRLWGTAFSVTKHYHFFVYLTTSH